jgi:hypothetical protein
MEHFIEIGRIMVATGATFVLGKIFEYLIKGRQERKQRAEESRRWEEELHRFKMLALKCVITNKELSRQARLDAYDEYTREGGNSWVKTYVSDNLKAGKD